MKYFAVFILFTCLISVMCEDKEKKENKDDEKKSVQNRSNNNNHKRSSSTTSKNQDQTVDDLALQLAKLHLMQLIAEKQSKVSKVQVEVKELEQDNCGVLTSVGDPVAHYTSNYVYGAWMRDPTSRLGYGKIWVAENYYTNSLYEYDNMEDLKTNTKSKSYSLPYNRDGTGSVVYGGNYYYNRYNSYYIEQYDLKTATRVRSGYPHTSLSGRKYNYGWGGYTSMDLAVDESGLWVIYSISNTVYVTKMQTKTLTAMRTWSLSGAGSYTSLGNAFIACGVFYAIDSYSGYSTTINFAYDFATGRQWNPNIKFRNFMSQTYSVSYNPAEKKLYAWSYYGHLVTYPLVFGSRP